MTLHNRDLQQRSEIFVLVKHFKRLSPRAQNGDRFHHKSLQFMINKNNTMTNQQHITTTTWSTTPSTSKPLSILHLAVAATSAVRSNSFLDDESISLFPSAQVFLSSLNSSPTPLILKSTVKDVQVVEFLLQCGFSTSCRNNEAKTPVHTAALKVSKIVTIIKMMMTGMIVDGARWCMMTKWEGQGKVMWWHRDRLTWWPVRQTACLNKPLELSTTELDLHLMSIRDPI